MLNCAKRSFFRRVKGLAVPTIDPKALFVVDGSYLLYRSFFAMRPLYSSNGTPTQAVYGFCRAIKKLIDDFNLSNIIIAWDSKSKSFRSEIYADYKVTRQKPPSELFVQKDYIFQFLDAIKMARLNVEGYEGDDVIAALAQRYPDRQVVLVCPDKDMYQLLSDRVLIFDPFKERVIDAATFTTENGFGPDKIPFYYALLGDTSDNIPGVAGIGKKTAQELVMQFASLDDLYANLDQVKRERLRTMLAEQKDNAFLSYKLFCLKPPAIDVDERTMHYDKNNWRGAVDLFRELEFGSLLKEIEKNFPGATAKPTLPEQQTDLFAMPAAPSWETVVVDTLPALDAMVARLAQTRYCAMDTETTGPEPVLDELVGISLAVDTERAYYIPVGHTTGTQLPRAVVIERLKPLLEDPKTTVVMHHAKFDQMVLLKAGIDMPPVAFDTLLAANLVRNEWQKINLKDLSQFFLQEPMKKFKDVIGKQYKTFAEVPIPDGAPYAAHDALQTFKLKPLLEKALDQEPVLKKIFYDIEMPFYYVLLRMECLGILLDPVVLKKTAKAVNEAIATLEVKLFAALEQYPGYNPLSFNVGSPRQVETLLFDVLGLPVIKKSDKGSRSTDQEVLEALSAMHPIPALIVKHRELLKLKNTYLDPLPSFINPASGRIHTIYSQTQVATGRLSSSDPNLQNIPAAEGFGMEIRSAFIAPEGKILMSADYSQVELRILAHLSQDPALTAIFANNQDIHAQTAAQLFDVPVDQVTNQQRQLGKRINFSIIYGMSPFGLAKDLGIKQGEAKLYIEKYFAQYPSVNAWMEKTVADAVIKGYVETFMGRRRLIPELRERNKAIFEAGKRVAINSPVQGTQAEIMKVAMINIDRLLIEKKLASRMILQIHDEIVLEIPQSEIEMVQNLVRQQMETVVCWEVPLKVSIRIGKDWAEITK